MLTAVDHEDPAAQDSSSLDSQPSPLFSTGAKILSGVFTDSNVASHDDADSHKHSLSVPGSLGNMSLPALSSLAEPFTRAPFHEQFDRDFQNHFGACHLASGSPGVARLYNQHKLLTMILSEYPPPLIDVLQDDSQGPQKAVLDIGCGMGAWLAEIAADFSHVDAVGVDLVPPLVTYSPKNVRTEVDDINLGLEHFYGQFNVLNARLISAGVKNYAGLVDEISRILRPGGLVILCECDFRVYDDKFEPLFLPTASTARSPSIPAVACFVEYLRRSIQAQGGHVDAASLLCHWVGQHRAFKDTVYRNFYFPLCPFMQADSPETRRQHEIGLCARENVLAVLNSRPLLLTSGLSEEEVDGLIFRAKQELTGCQITCYMRLQYVYARRRR